LAILAVSLFSLRSYKIKSWKDYNESLVRRGDITFRFDENTIDAWEHSNEESKVGRPFTYSDTAIECLLMLRKLFRLPYRQTEGLYEMLFWSNLENRNFENQKTEAKLRSKILNRFTHLGLPQFEGN